MGLQKTIIYVRHADDEKSRYKLDEKLQEEGKEKSRHVAKKLIKTHGVPDVIYYSPMRRTRQTAKEFFRAVESYQKHHHSSAPAKNTRMEIEPRIGRLFTHKQQRQQEKNKTLLRRSTKNVIMDKDKIAFRERVAKQFEEISHTENSNGDQIIWNITHSLVLLHVARINNIERNSHVKYLDTLSIKTFLAPC